MLHRVVLLFAVVALAGCRCTRDHDAELGAVGDAHSRVSWERPAPDAPMRQQLDEQLVHVLVFNRPTALREVVGQLLDEDEWPDGDGEPTILASYHGGADQQLVQPFSLSDVTLREALDALARRTRTTWHLFSGRVVFTR